MVQNKVARFLWTTVYIYTLSRTHKTPVWGLNSLLTAQTDNFFPVTNNRNPDGFKNTPFAISSVVWLVNSYTAVEVARVTSFWHWLIDWFGCYSMFCSLHCVTLQLAGSTSSRLRFSENPDPVDSWLDFSPSLPPLWNSPYVHVQHLHHYNVMMIHDRHQLLSLHV